MVNAWYYIRQTRQTNQSTRRDRVDRILNGQCMVPIVVCRVFWAGAFITFIY